MCRETTGTDKFSDVGSVVRSLVSRQTTTILKLSPRRFTTRIRTTTSTRRRGTWEGQQTLHPSLLLSYYSRLFMYVTTIFIRHSDTMVFGGEAINVLLPMYASVMREAKRAGAHTIVAGGYGPIMTTILSSNFGRFFMIFFHGNLGLYFHGTSVNMFASFVTKAHFRILCNRIVIRRSVILIVFKMRRVAPKVSNFGHAIEGYGIRK